MDLVVCEDGVRVFDLVHVRESWCMVEKGWVCLSLDMIVCTWMAARCRCFHAFRVSMVVRVPIVLMMVVSCVLAAFVRHERERT